MVLKRNVLGGVPSPYPRFLFHGLRCAQLIAAIIVSGIMAYFIHYLRTLLPPKYQARNLWRAFLTMLLREELEHYTIPWTFIVVCLLSLVWCCEVMIAAEHNAASDRLSWDDRLSRHHNCFIQFYLPVSSIQSHAKWRVGDSVGDGFCYA